MARRDAAAMLEARRITVRGRVQGVGFRPFVRNLAADLGVTGWVRNENGRVTIHAEGSPVSLDAFTAMLKEKAPPLAQVDTPKYGPVPVEGYVTFVIEASLEQGEADIHLPPDLFVCDDCLAEMADLQARRFAYPFINCTQCGPRYTIVTALPYDRPATTMADFALCPACQREYDNPADRRFHAQPLACPDCGPQCRFECGDRQIEDSRQAIAVALQALGDGRIIAVKGVGGYHLMADAMNGAAIAELRTRKHRPDKPLAVVFPMGDGPEALAPLKTMLAPDEAECAALLDPARPIVLVARRKNCRLPQSLAPGLAEIGAFLPYSPLHYLLLAEFGGPLVATSGNLSGEPVLTGEEEARTRLAKIADGFLHHNRPIARPADDSVLRVIAGAPRPIRLGRGIAPVELNLPEKLAEPVLALGGHMKSTVALGFENRAVISPHIGDLDSLRSLDVFARVIEDLQALYGVRAARILCDAHPGYASTKWAKATGLPISAIQHHHAHASALTFEQPQIESWLVFAWDGVGYGGDGTLWGGEALYGKPGNWRRFGSLLPLRPIGGDRAAREPWRSAAAACWQTGHDYASNQTDPALARQAWENRLNCPITSAIGRLFDAAACLVLGIEKTGFEGQAAMCLEAIASLPGEAIELPLLQDDGLTRIDWTPLIAHMRDDAIDAGKRAGDFHETLAAAAVAQAKTIAKSYPFDRVGLSGGVFQNRRLCEAFGRRFDQAEIPLHMGSKIPVNDAGLSFGQIIEELGRQSGNDNHG